MWNNALPPYRIRLTLMCIMTLLPVVAAGVDASSYHKIAAVVVLWCAGAVLLNREMLKGARERETVRRELAETNAFLDSIIENIPHMIFVKDAEDLRFVRFNRAGEELLGYSREELVGKNDYDFFPKQEADFFTSKDRATLLSGRVLDIPEESVETRHKGRRILHTKKIPLLDAAGRPLYLLGISEDITERKQAEREAETLSRTNRELEQFARTASHDLREPLRKIVLFGEKLKHRLADRVPEDDSHSLNRMIEAGARMDRLIEDLLLFSRSADQALTREAVDLDRVVRDVLGDLELRIAETRASIRVGPLPGLTGCPVQIRQLLQNLIANALKFSKKDDPPRIEIEGRKTGDGWIELKVRDHGIGFAEKDLDRIFKPFQRLHTRQEFEGSGLGLSICKKILDGHGGTLTAHSAPGEGCVFVARFPDVAPPASPAS